MSYELIMEYYQMAQEILGQQCISGLWNNWVIS